MMRSLKATRGQVKQHNQGLVLRLVYNNIVNNRAALAQKTGLTKPAISSLVAELIEAGLLNEEGYGESTDSGGKRPRLLQFVPSARQVIGLSIHKDHARGVLTHLDGHVIASHAADLPDTEQPEIILARLITIINGLVAQLSAPLLCIGLGVGALVDEAGQIQYAPSYPWQYPDLGEALSAHYQAPVYVSNNTELAARAQYAFGKMDQVERLVTILVDNGVGVGLVAQDGMYAMGAEIGHLRPSPVSLDEQINWYAIRARAENLAQKYGSDYLGAGKLTYLRLYHAANHGDDAALQVMGEIAAALGQVFAWALAMLRPNHLSLAGDIADLGESFLEMVLDHTRQMILPELVEMTAFSCDSTANLIAIGAAAKSVQLELGLV